MLKLLTYFQARSKFYGNSVSAIMDGHVKLMLLNRIDSQTGQPEEYRITLPYANCKGILIGRLTMELGGKIQIECARTGYSADIEFKLKPLLGGVEASNLVEGKIRHGKETHATLTGKWDGEIWLHDKRTIITSAAVTAPVAATEANAHQHHHQQKTQHTLLWSPSKQVIESRLKRYVVPVAEQMEFESVRLWERVSNAIRNQVSVAFRSVSVFLYSTRKLCQTIDDRIKCWPRRRKR